MLEKPANPDRCSREIQPPLPWRANFACLDSEEERDALFIRDQTEQVIYIDIHILPEPRLDDIPAASPSACQRRASAPTFRPGAAVCGGSFSQSEVCVCVKRSTGNTTKHRSYAVRKVLLTACLCVIAVIAVSLTRGV